MDNKIRIQLSQRIARPIDVVKSHFFDIAHHMKNNVHHQFKFEILGHETNQCRFTQEFRLLGMKQKDELLLRRNADGSVVQEFVTGLNAGGRIEVAFRADGPQATIVDATAAVPKRGIKRLLAPIVKLALTQLGRQTLEQDRHDLEECNYQPPRS